MVQFPAMAAPSTVPAWVPAGTAGEALVHIDFEGGCDETAPLTWGQRAVWKSVVEFTDHSWLNFRRVLAVPRRANADVASVGLTIGALMARHSSLRTRLRVVDGERRQVAAGRGRLPVIVVSAGDNDEATAHEWRDRLGSVPYDFAEEWPLRVAFVVGDERVRFVVVVISHAAADLHACEILVRDLRLLLLRGSISTPPGLQSLDVARREAGDARHSERAVALWMREYARLPESMFPAVGQALTPRFRRAQLESPAVDAAARLIAARHEVSTSTVLLAATATLVTSWTGHDVCGVFTMSNNRFPDGYADAISKLNQLGLFVINLADRPTFAKIVPLTWQAALRAYQHAYYDPMEMDAALRSAGRPCGSGLEPWCYFNDLRLPDTDLPNGPPLDEAAIRASLADSRLHWPETLERFAWRFRLQVMDVPGATGLSLTTDTSYLPPAEAERFLREFEALVVAAAFDDLPWPWTASI